MIQKTLSSIDDKPPFDYETFHVLLNKENNMIRS